MFSSHHCFLQQQSAVSLRVKATFCLPAVFPRYGRDAKVVHFLGKVKPWNHTYGAQRGEVRGHSLSPDLCQLHPDYLLMWWQLYSKSVLPLLRQAYGDTPFSSGFVEVNEDVSQHMC